MSRYFGQILKENNNLTDHRNDPALSGVWNVKCQDYYDMKTRQEQELEEYGYLKMYNSDKENEA